MYDRPIVGPERCEVRLQGHLDNRWDAWFEGLSVTNRSDGTTVIDGVVVDQSALHGLLQKVRDVGLPLISINRMEPITVTTRPDGSRSPVSP